MMRTQVRRLWGQRSTGPSGVVAQWMARMRSPSSLPPSNRAWTASGPSMDRTCRPRGTLYHLLPSMLGGRVRGPLFASLAIACAGAAPASPEPETPEPAPSYAERGPWPVGTREEQLVGTD